MIPSCFLCRNSTAYAVPIVFLRFIRIIRLERMTETFLHSITEMPLLQKRRKQYMTAQNKETYLESMNEEYKQKHYPEGSVFKAHKKAMVLFQFTHHSR